MSNSKKGQYVVQRGDTVESIAKKLGMSPYALVSQNPSIRSRKLQQGERLNYYSASSQNTQSSNSASSNTPAASQNIANMLNGALGAAGGALSSSYLRAETLEDALAALKREAGLSDLSDEEAVERAQQFRRQNLLQQATQAYPGQVYDIGKLLDNAGTSLSDTTMQIISNITGMDYSGVSGNSSNNLNRQQRALLALGELSDLTNLSPVAGQEIDREAIYRQAYAEAEADYANRILNAVNSLNTKRRNNQDKRETLQEDYLKDMRELADQTEEDSEDALQDSIKKGTARSSILDGLQAEIEQNSQDSALQLETDLNNTLSRLDRELKDIESAGQATLDLLEKNKQLAAQKEYEKQLQDYQEEQDRLSSINANLTGTLLTPDAAVKQLNKLDKQQSLDYLKKNEKKLRRLWGNSYDSVLKRYS